MHQRAQVRPNGDGTWTATLPPFGFRLAPEAKILPTQRAACTWAHNALSRPGSNSCTAESAGGGHDGISTVPSWTPLVPAEREW